MVMGRPPKYKTALELQEKIDEFFNAENQTITISGLCYYLGFSSRQSFYDLQKKGEFSYTVKKARIRIEMYYESMLLTRASTGAIFALKNFGWTDKQEIDHTSKGDKINTQPSIVVSDQKTADELKKLLDAND